jgi:aspartate racemase
VSREREARDFEFEADFRTRTIGMIGGMSWESSAIYYWMVNEAVKERLGGHHSADTLMYSVDFAPIKRLQHESRWEETAASLARAARKVEQGGAGFVVLRTNTLHRMADAITEAVSIPLLHIIDATAEEIKALGIKRVGLLATRFTMVRDFYKGDWLEIRSSGRIIPAGPDGSTRRRGAGHPVLGLGELLLADRRHVGRGRGKVMV